jgi:hypothetical protein
MALHSQNGWTAYDTSLLAWFPVPGTDVHFRLRKAYAGPLLVAAAELYSLTVQPIAERLGCWSYDGRLIAGSTIISNHASGTAVDLNATLHPQGKVGSYTPTQRAALLHIINLAGGALRSGEFYVHALVDGMHLEVNTTSIPLILSASRNLALAIAKQKPTK